jgi:hypothetical protein
MKCIPTSANTVCVLHGARDFSTMINIYCIFGDKGSVKPEKGVDIVMNRTVSNSHIIANVLFLFFKGHDLKRMLSML